MSRLTRSAVPLFLLLGLAAGCHHGGLAPAGWTGEPIDPQQITSNEDPSQATLQVVICYGKVFSNHTALRLIAPGRQTLMWDPGGTYSQADPTRARRHDVLTQNAPTIDEWWRYRRDGCLEPVMEVFQWPLEAQQADRLHALLTRYQDPADPAQSFEPDAGGLQCCKKVSEYLMRFADGRPAVKEIMFWPHELGEHLWTQSPDRVIIFRRDGPAYVYRQGSASTASEQQRERGLALEPIHRQR